MYSLTDDVRIEGLKPLISPAILMEDLPLSDAGAARVTKARRETSDILRGRDDRLLVVVGPCSIHDPDAALEYAHHLADAAKELAGELHIVMRTYFEKPRTTIGWKGLINDPDLDGSFAINKGLHVARGLLRDLVELGVPTGTEFLDPISPQFVADLVSWGAIGARTTESQVHRELASGLSMPVGFKNGTGGAVKVAVDAVSSASHPHRFLSVTKQGITAIVHTKGNPDCHVIHRGGAHAPNYDAESVAKSRALLEAAGLEPRLMIDCSHANSGKDPDRQPAVAADVGAQLASGSDAIFGVMIESFLEDGRQDRVPGTTLVRGQSITDGCLGWARTRPVLEDLARAISKRRDR
ncbi:MAG: 3-deoxy-7-phosphoheptulonate synthase [Deltaproteobacteria bacterium]|nr:3-deoxy-7-phosphoheptulonate synthase [Deltaproteobacteria bacterium]